MARMENQLAASRPLRLRDYRYPGELLSLALTFIILLSLYALFTIFFPAAWSTTVKTLVITLAGLGVYVLTVKLQQRAAFGTMVRVGPRQFPELYQITTTAAERLSSAPVPVYVKRASEMNIYTLGFWRQPLIVMTSSLVDQMQPDELQFFIGRELGHIQAGHTWLRTLLKPLGADVPVIGRLLNSVIFGDWINRGELTADRAGLLACRSLTTAINTMLKFGVGVALYRKLDIKEFLDQINDVRNVRGHLTEIVAEQPYLTQRIRALVRFSLSERLTVLLPERERHTGILQSIPDTFVSSRLRAVEPAQIEEPAVAVATTSSTLRQPAFNTSRDSAEITIADAPESEDPNGFDPRTKLVEAETGHHHLLRRHCTRIGRHLDNDIVINSDRVSRNHAEILRDGDSLLVIDKQSRNGIRLNGAPVQGSAELKPGDVLRIGRQTFHLVYE